MNNADRLEHTRPLFSRQRILRLEEIHFYKIALVMFKVYQDVNTPEVFRKLFKLNSDIHDHDTRQKHHFHVPSSKTNYMDRAISVKGVFIWNQLLKKDITLDCSYLSFKIPLKNYVRHNLELIEYIC